MVDQAKAAVEYAKAKAFAAGLDEPARTYMNYVNTGDVAQLGPVLLPHVADLGADPAARPRPVGARRAGPRDPDTPSRTPRSIASRR
jgi:hypothetical protein